MSAEGILVGPGAKMSLSLGHTDQDLEATLTAAGEAIRTI